MTAPNDFEMDRTGGRIRFMLESTRWHRYVGPIPIHQPFYPGVKVRTWFGDGAEQAYAAGDALVTMLGQEGIDAERGAPIKELGPNVVYIEVGPKPLPTPRGSSPVDIDLVPRCMFCKITGGGASHLNGARRIRDESPGQPSIEQET
jgi:hypothetical protein